MPIKPFNRIFTAHDRETQQRAQSITVISHATGGIVWRGSEARIGAHLSFRPITHAIAIRIDILSLNLIEPRRSPRSGRCHKTHL